MAIPELEPNESEASITALLAKLSKGERDAEAQLIPRVCEELRRLARHYMLLEGRNHTLQPTALVHEAHVRLVHQTQVVGKAEPIFLQRLPK